MKPKFHFIASAILAVLLFPFFEWLALLVFVFGFLIDFDHYAYFAVKEKRLNPLKTYKMLIECINNQDFSKLRRDELHVLHTVEAWALIIVLSVLSGRFSVPLLAGLAFHIVLDGLWEEMLERKGYKVRGIRATSLFFWIARRLGKSKKP